MHKSILLLIILNHWAIQAVKGTHFSFSLGSCLGKSSVCPDPSYYNYPQNGDLNRICDRLANSVTVDPASHGENYVAYINAAKEINTDFHESHYVERLFKDFIELDSIASAMDNKKFNCFESEAVKLVNMMSVLEKFSNRPVFSDPKMLLNKLVSEMADSFLCNCANELGKEVQNFESIVEDEEDRVAVRNVYEALSHFDIFLEAYYHSGDLRNLMRYSSPHYNSGLFSIENVLKVMENLQKESEDQRMPITAERSASTLRNKLFLNLLSMPYDKLRRFQPLLRKFETVYQLISAATELAQVDLKLSCSFSRTVLRYYAYKVAKQEFLDYPPSFFPLVSSSVGI